MKKNTWIAVGISLAVIGFFFFGGDIATFFTTGQIGSANVVQSGSVNNPQGGTLIIQDETVGTGAVAENGDVLTVNYVGTLTDGTKFDSSIDRGTPFQFTLGAGQVIQGWEQGFVGMKVGGKRKLIIPPSLAYGANQVGPIPPNSTLIFEVELLKVQPPTGASGSATSTITQQ
jgi:FKBP-type peptidyl-prolyl cis-trans isomerase FkpA